MIEDRKFERTEHLFPLQKGLVQDFSQSGLCLNIKQRKEKGSVMHLRLRSHDQGIVIKAQVMHVGEERDDLYSTGLQFVDLTQEQQEIIAKMWESYGQGVPLKVDIFDA